MKLDRGNSVTKWIERNSTKKWFGKVTDPCSLSNIKFTQPVPAITILTFKGQISQVHCTLILVALWEWKIVHIKDIRVDWTVSLCLNPLRAILNVWIYFYAYAFMGNLMLHFLIFRRPSLIVHTYRFLVSFWITIGVYFCFDTWHLLFNGGDSLFSQHSYY